MYHSSQNTINGAHGAISKTYLEEYRHLGPLQDAPATYDYKKYMATSLIRRGFLFENSKNIEELYRSSLEELFSSQFKNIFLYDPNRVITDIYSSIDNVKHMGPVGTHDYFASVLGLIPAKYVPIFEPFDYDFKTDDSIELDYTEEEKRNIIIMRGQHDSTTFNYIKLSAYDKIIGPNLGTTYFVNPKLPDTEEYVKVDTLTESVDPNTTYYKKDGDVYNQTTDFDIVEEFTKLEGEALNNGPEENKIYYKKTKNPNTINYVRASGIPDHSAQYYIKDPANPENYIIADTFNDRRDYVKVENKDSKYPIEGINYYRLNSNNEYVKCTESDFGKEYSYGESSDIRIEPDKTYYIQNINGTYRAVDDSDFLHENITEETETDVYHEVVEKAAGPQSGTTYYVKNIISGEYVPISIDNLPSHNTYEQTQDLTYDPSKTYYVKENGSYRVATESDFDKTENTTLQQVDVYNPTEDETYDPSKTYYVSDGDTGYVEAQESDILVEDITEERTFDVYNPTEDETYDPSKTYYVSDGDTGYVEAQESDILVEDITEERTFDVYNPTEDETYDPSKTYYVSDGDTGYVEAQESDYDIDPDTSDKSFKENALYYERTQETRTVPTGEKTYSFDPNKQYYERTQETRTVPTGEKTYSFDPNKQYYERTQEEQASADGTFTISFKSNTVYYELTSSTKVFENAVTYYTKTTETGTIVTGQNISFNPDLTYYERTSYRLIFVINIDYYTIEVVGKAFVPSIQYYIKQVIDNGYKYEENNLFDTSETYNLIDTTTEIPDPLATYYVQNNGQYESRENVEIWDAGTEYYTKTISRSFKQDQEYYNRETLVKFKVASLTDPTYEYYVKNIIDNGYDLTKYEVADVSNGFEDRNYYTADIDFENTELTEDELISLRKTKVINKLNELFDYYIKDTLTTAREIFLKHSISEVTKSVHMEASDYELHAIRILYKKMLQVLYVMVYTINVSPNLDDTCVPYKIINESIDKLLSRVRILGEMIPTKHYYTKKVLNNFITEEKKQEVFYRYGIVSPFSDLVTLEDQTVTIDEMTMKLTENIINYRNLIERTDLVSETNMSYLFGLFTMTFNIFTQLFFNSAYLSRNKQPLVMSVTELFKRFTPNFNNIIDGDSIKNFIKLSE